MYADYEFYVTRFLAGSEPMIPAEDYERYEAQAEDVIRYASQNRSESYEGDEVKRCACELAELLCGAARASQAASDAGGSGLLSSYNNDGLQASFAVQESDYTAEGIRKKKAEIIRKHLLWTGLLYRGAAYD